MERIGILGGTFDPPHLGHLILGEYAVDALDLTQVLFLPAADPPHKQDRPKTAVAHRVSMLALALADNAHFSLSRVDLDRPGPHYSVDAVRILQSSTHIQKSTLSWAAIRCAICRVAPSC